MNNPPQTTTTSDNETCATTSTLRNVKVLRLPCCATSAAPFSTGTTSGFEECHAGARPKIKPVASEITSVKISARVSIAKKLLTMWYSRTGTKPCIRSVTQNASNN